MVNNKHSDTSKSELTSPGSRERLRVARTSSRRSWRPHRASATCRSATNVWNAYKIASINLNDRDHSPLQDKPRPDRRPHIKSPITSSEVPIATPGLFPN